MTNDLACLSQNKKKQRSTNNSFETISSGRFTRRNLWKRNTMNKDTKQLCRVHFLTRQKLIKKSYFQFNPVEIFTCISKGNKYVTKHVFCLWHVAFSDCLIDGKWFCQKINVFLHPVSYSKTIQNLQRIISATILCLESVEPSLLARFCEADVKGANLMEHDVIKDRGCQTQPPCVLFTLKSP